MFSLECQWQQRCNMNGPSLDDFLDLLRCPVSLTPLIVEDGGETLRSGLGLRYACSDTGGGLLPMLVAEPGLMPPETLAQQRHYEKIAGEYQENLAFPHTKAYQAYLDGALKAAAGQAELRVAAEICCGRGEAFQLFKEGISRGVGVDISLSMLRAAKAGGHGNRVLFVQGDATALPLADDGFDAVFLLGGIHHVADKAKLYRECRRILKPGGLLVAREPADDFFLWRWLRKIIYALSPNLDGQTERPLRKRDDLALLEKAGFTLGEWKTYGFLGYCLFMNSDVLKVNAAFRHVPGIEKIVGWAAAFDSLCLKMPGLRNAGAQVVFWARNGPKQGPKGV